MEWLEQEGTLKIIFKDPSPVPWGGTPSISSGRSEPIQPSSGVSSVLKAFILHLVEKGAFQVQGPLPIF